METVLTYIELGQDRNGKVQGVLPTISSVALGGISKSINIGLLIIGPSLRSKDLGF